MCYLQENTSAELIIFSNEFKRTDYNAACSCRWKCNTKIFVGFGQNNSPTLDYDFEYRYKNSISKLCILLENMVEDASGMKHWHIVET